MVALFATSLQIVLLLLLSSLDQSGHGGSSPVLIFRPLLTEVPHNSGILLGWLFWRSCCCNGLCQQVLPSGPDQAEDTTCLHHSCFELTRLRDRRTQDTASTSLCPWGLQSPAALPAQPKQEMSFLTSALPHLTSMKSPA